ncbi:hypothetical protein BA896_012705 [Janthinobacterium lividum]|uniref:HK97 gp10 family phage protein n=1 Tax=Janthinobacterium lividum TaxID=29581 RepID=A0A1E8PTG1_9BURK|nr:hypothetical protein BA896_012705 [Janthinobacterium lividum]
MADLKITGMDQLRARMAGLQPKLLNGAIRAGVRQGANIIKAQARANFDGAVGPGELSGALKASIRVTPRRGTPTRIRMSIVAGTLTKSQTKKFGAESAYYSLWVERGHINRKLGEALRGSRAAAKAARAESTSNTPARPYLKPALDAKAQPAIDMLVSTIISKLPEVVK